MFVVTILWVKAFLEGRGESGDSRIPDLCWELSLSRAKQTSIPGWEKPKKN
jgi:hypothetical protein